MVATSKVPARGCAACTIAVLAVLIPGSLSGQSPRAAVLVSVRVEAKRAFASGNADEARTLLEGRAPADTAPASLRSAQARLFQLHAVIGRSEWSTGIPWHDPTVGLTQRSELED